MRRMPDNTKAYSKISFAAIEMDNTKVVTVRNISRARYQSVESSKSIVEYEGRYCQLYDKRLMRPLVNKLKKEGYVVLDERVAKMFSASSKSADFVKNFDRKDQNWLKEEQKLTTKVIKNGTVCTADRTWKADVLIEGETIKQIGEDLKGDEYIDAEGAYVIPGGIDPHTHLEMPFMGTTAAETFETGTWAAACGGTTMLVDFCLPGADGSIKNAINEWHRKSAPQICADIGYHMAITGWNESIFNEMKDAVDMGVNSFKHFMAYKGALMIEDDEMFASFKRCAELGALPMVHAENGDLVAELQEKYFNQGITGPEGHAYFPARRSWRARPRTARSPSPTPPVCRFISCM